MGLVELIRWASGATLDQASALVRQVQAPVGGVVEDFGDRKLVLAELPTREEILVLLYSDYPALVSQRQLLSNLDRASPKSVLNALKVLWRRKLVEGTPETGYTLTQKGLREAAGVMIGGDRENSPSEVRKHSLELSRRHAW